MTNSGLDFFWKNIKTEKNWLRTIASMNAKEEQFFFTWDSKRKRLLAYHPKKGIFPIRKSDIEKMERRITKDLSSEKAPKKLKGTLEERLAYMIFSDYTFGKRNGMY